MAVHFKEKTAFDPSRQFNERYYGSNHSSFEPLQYKRIEVDVSKKRYIYNEDENCWKKKYIYHIKRNKEKCWAISEQSQWI